MDVAPPWSMLPGLLETLAMAFSLGGHTMGFLLGRPYYGTFVPDLTLRMGTELLTVAFDGEDPLGVLAVKKYEEVILQSKDRGQKIAGLIVAHPHNPLGRCYPRNVLVELLKLCQRHQVHFISDEIYALSTFENNVDKDVKITPFESALSIDLHGIIDPGLVHAIWGISKDFGANGLRLGTLISQSNPALHAALVPAGLYSSSSSLTDHVVTNILDDEEWVDKYIAENRRQLGASYEYVTAWAGQQGVDYAPGVNSAFFLWVNLGKAYQARHKIGDEDLDEVVMNALLKERVFLASGVQFGSEEPGWFRIVFSQKRDYLALGLHRVADALKRSDDGLDAGNSAIH